MSSTRKPGDVSDTQRHNPREKENAAKSAMARDGETIHAPQGPAAHQDEVSALTQVTRASDSVPTRARRPDERNPELDKAGASGGQRREPNAPQMQREDAGTPASGNSGHGPDGEELRQAPLASRDGRKA